MIVLKDIGVGFFVNVLMTLLIIYLCIDIIRKPQKEIPKRRGLKRYDYIVIAAVPENKWTEHKSVRIGIDLVDEPFTYLYTALLINNDTKVYKLNDIWVEKETKHETEYSKFIGITVENYLLSQKTT